jgi:magnesium chelatase subunit I
VVEVSADSPASQYREFFQRVPAMNESLKNLGLTDSPAQLASAAEFILEGLHLNQKLNKELRRDKMVYKTSPPTAPKPKPVLRRERGEGFH